MNTDVDRLIEYIAVTTMKGKYKGIGELFEEYKIKDGNKLIRILLKENKITRGEIMRKYSLSKIENEIDRLINKVKEINSLISENECNQLKSSKKDSKIIQKIIDERNTDKNDLIEEIEELKREREAIMSIED
jgi:hypothetical protein